MAAKKLEVGDRVRINLEVLRKSATRQRDYGLPYRLTGAFIQMDRLDGLRPAPRWWTREKALEDIDIINNVYTWKIIRVRVAGNGGRKFDLEYYRGNERPGWVDHYNNVRPSWIDLKEDFNKDLLKEFV